MAQRDHLHLFEHDLYKIATAGDELEFRFGDYSGTADTATLRYIDLGANDNNAQGLVISADQDFTITQINRRDLKVARSVASGTNFTIQRGDWHQIKIQTSVANTTVKVDVVA